VFIRCFERTQHV